MSDAASLARQALLRREAAISVVVNSAISVGFFLLVFGWTPAATRLLAIDFLPQTAGITFLGGLVPSLLTLRKIAKRSVLPVGPAPTRRAQALRVVVCALIAMPVLGGSAALLLLASGPSVMAPLPALILKATYGGLVGLLTTPFIVRMALGMPFWPGRADGPSQSEHADDTPLPRSLGDAG